MFTTININGCNLLNDSNNDKTYIKSNLSSIALNADSNSNGVNNLLTTAAVILSILCDDKDSVKKLESIFKEDSIRLANVDNINNYRDYIANVECTANPIIVNAIDWFKSEFTDMIDKVLHCDIDEDSKIKIVDEMDSILNSIISWIVTADDNTLLSLGYNVHSIKETEKIPDAISFTNKKLIEIYKEISKELIDLILGGIEVIEQPLITEQAGYNIPPEQQDQFTEDVVDPEPQINIEVEPNIVIDILDGDTTPTMDIPRGYSANSGEQLATPFINYQMPYYVPQYNDEDINRHFIINGIVNIPDVRVQNEFGILLKNVCKYLDEKDKLLGLTEPSKYIFTLFYTNTYWRAERVRTNGIVYSPSDKYYSSLNMMNGNLQWFGPSR